MFTLLVRAFLALSCASWVAAQQVGTAYQFTTGVTNPAPVPGKPFTLTWTGGQPNEVVYIILTYYFPEDPNQDIPYGTTDVLSNAPNNGSWTYNVPLHIFPGRYSFGIGENPLLQSDSTPIFTITSSETPYAVAPGAPANTAFQTYNGCGLPPLNDYTYTGYQPPCTTTSNGRVETLYPIVPISDSSSFWGSSYLGQVLAPTPPVATTSSSSLAMSSSSPSFNTAFATGVFAQVLQCPTPVTPSSASITIAGVTTIFSSVGCAPPSGATANSAGVCHTSGYTTFSVSGTSSVCCPSGWATTPLDTELFCFTSTAQVARRQVSTETLAGGSGSSVEISGLAFTSAGVVTREAAVASGSASTASGSSGMSTQSTSTTTGLAASASTTKSRGKKLSLGLWGKRGVAAAMLLLYIFV